MLNKQDININFQQGLDTKSDPFQIPTGKFLALTNSVFTKAGLLQKRNGFGLLSQLPSASVASPAHGINYVGPSAEHVATFNGGLEVVANQNLYSLSSSTGLWASKGLVQTADLATLPLVRSSNNQSYADAAIAANGLILTAYVDNPASGTAYMYTVADSVTGQVIVSPAAITAASGNTNTSPRVFVLGSYFIILFGTSSNHIQYIAVSTMDPTVVTTAVDITSSYVSSSTVNFDGIVSNNKLFIAFNSTSGGQSVKVTYLGTSLGSPVTAKVFAGSIATMFTLTADSFVPQSAKIYISFYDLPSTTAKTIIVDTNLNTVLAATTLFTSGTILNLASTAYNGVCTFFYEVSNNYSYDAGVPTHFINRNTITVAGTVGTAAVMVRSVGLASKAVLIDNTPYLLTAYQSTPQPSYFLMDSYANIIGKLAYANGGGYLTRGLPNLTVTDSTTLNMPYLLKDLISSENKGTALASSVPIAAVYSQTGINLASFNLMPSTVTSSEIGQNLNISGGLVWAFDGLKPVEQSFNVWPDNVEITTSTSGGHLADQDYYYQVTYEWADNNGNVFRSAPSIPVKQTAGGGGNSTNTINVPNLRLTYKTNVKIVVYRWSTAQQVYYSITSPSAAPVISSTTSDSTAITDTLADSSIIGNPILYTTGGVIENIGPPATNLLTLFNNRLWLVDAEDTNLLWFSKQIIEATPVEMSDLLTLYVAPTTGAQGSTGPITALSALDDKLIVFKKDAAYYINGVGPDNTGSNSTYSDAVFISSVVGCSNQNSIVFIPSGLMFQSDKGIWLLGRDLSTNYIGAPVESFTQDALVESAINVPGTNQVRFTLDSGVTLMYDYFYGQWSSFTNIPAVSSVVYQGLHTYLNSNRQVFQETIGSYLDNTSPVLLSFTTNWMNLAGLQGFERFYQMLMLGQYYTPFKLNVQFCYDYNINPSQSVIVSPDNYAPTWGGQALWGSSSPWGGPSQAFKARVFPSTQKVEAFQIIVNELYDATLGIQAGAGLTLSGLDLTIGMKRGHRTNSAGKSFG